MAGGSTRICFHFFILAALCWALPFCAADGKFVRKNVDQLTPMEILELQVALRSMQDDDGPTGYQAISAYHGEPADCKAADGSTVVCCLHGMPSFPMWHRLYMVQFEQALSAHGSKQGIPYWDWTRPMTHLPELVQHPLFIDPSGKKAKKNVFYSGEIKFENKVTARAVDARLYEASNKGHKNFLLEGVLNALEHEDFCHFEVQFEVAHNPIHYLVGGRITHSMSSLEYTSYDPIFFLHHSNVERQFALWQALQKHRGLSTKANCGLNLFHQPMEPFSRETNPFALTKDNAKPVSLFEYEQLGYEYDDLTLNGMTIEELNNLLKQRKSKARAFANFRLGGIKTSANVQINICIPNKDGRHSDNCDNYAGEFFILGGKHEMPWHFAYPYLYDITDKVHSLGLNLDGDYYIHTIVTAINGTLLADDIIPKATVSYIPAKDHHDPEMRDVDETTLKTRKDINRLTHEEEYELRVAMERFMADKSIDGYQALAEFHGLPAKCPRPDALNRVACCAHGMATFPHWHRLVVVQFEDALSARGSPIGVPYWDWTKPIDSLPHLLTDETYLDPYTNETKPNPFFRAPIDFLHDNIFTARKIDERLFKKPTVGDHGYLYDGMLLAFEQHDFCDFEVQFEVTHNAIHAWVGGNEQYSMSTLHYTSFDPMFWLHHSQVDRLWAVWQALQIQRGLPYKAHCASSEVHQPLKPFAFDPPLNNDELTHSHSVPTDIYDYRTELKYTYDTLFFGGMSIRELQHHIEENEAKERVFAGFLLMGIHTSANVDLYVVAGENEFMVGSIAVLGGSKEMAWRFDRVYKHEITNALAALGIDKFGDYSLRVDIHDVNGTALPATIIPAPIVIYTPPIVEDVKFDESHRSRKDIASMTDHEMNELRAALTAFAADKTATGYQQVAAFHGSIKWCPSPDAAVKYACCQHGMATFPHWHRLLTVNYENGLRRNGYHGGVPYWDWTRPIHALPTLVIEEQYTDEKGETHPNPFFSGDIDEASAKTSRAPSPALFEQPEFGHYTHLADEIFYALEQENFCDFEVQFEIAHNHIHALVGGTEPYSMSSLEYSAFDPIFMLHHSNVDRIWATWQALQKFRGKSYNSANCAIEMLRRPMSPFSLSSDINPDSQTHEHSIPFEVFDYKKSFHYEYDTLEINGLSIPQLSREINRRRAKSRVFVTFMLEGLKKSLLVEYFIKDDASDKKMKAGEFYVLGSENEMPWKFDRSYKSDITHVMDEMHLHYTEKYHIEYTITDMKGEAVENVKLNPTVIYQPGFGEFGQGKSWTDPISSASRIRKNLKDLNKGEIESLKATFQHMKEDGKYEQIAAFHGLPAQCPNEDGTKVYTCCLHGMPTFPHWHRLYVALVEDELLARGSGVAVPYWDWIEPFEVLPKLFSVASYYNSRTLHIEKNPFFKGTISFENAITDRDPQPELFNNNYLHDHALFAFEQTDFCEFEVHYEVLHNTIHSWLGGRDPHSMSSLDYAAYDPVFFLHHSNLDRLWAIWQELQRYRKLSFNDANCALPLMNQPMRPFSNSTANQDRLTFTHSRPNDVFDYQNVLHYKYDTLSFDGLSIPEVEALLQIRKSHDRVFAGFLLQGIQASADVRIYICVPTGVGQDNCGYAGIFSILGGESEMPWRFDRLFRYEITDELKLLGLDHNSDFHINTVVKAVNGSTINQKIFPDPTIIFVPSHEDTEHTWNGVVTTADRIRKDLKVLTKDEMTCFAEAFQRINLDGTYEKIAAFHGLPAQCPNEDGSKVFTCCLHGMPTFPHWHRLYVALVENELLARGSCNAVPYWDWIEPFHKLPPLINDKTFFNPKTKKTEPNPFLKGTISFEHTETERSPQPELFDNRYLYDHALYALEQTDFCEFEVHYEVLHNTIHSWLGGPSVHSMSSLDFAAYDPVFFLHHSNLDRLWAIWQELQRYRNLEYNTASCAKKYMDKPMRPFSNTTANNDRFTLINSRPNDVFDYQNVLHYKYDTLSFSGLNIPQLENVLTNNKAHDRIFAGFSLHGIKASADVRIYICIPIDNEAMNCDHYAGVFSILGGLSEMPWHFDSLYRYEITKELKELDLDHKSTFKIKADITAVNGTHIDSHIFPEPTVIFVPKEERIVHGSEHSHSILVRKNADRLSLKEVNSLIHALKRMQEDRSCDGFEAIASFHALPPLCPNPTAEHRYACCVHGMATFPQWHRLYVVQFEQALHRHGAIVGVPYWDWTYPVKEIPSLIVSDNYTDPFTNINTFNPFSHGHISFISAETMTARDISGHLFEQPALGKQTWLFDNIILALEQTDYCDFEIQFEIVHNAIHSWLGGKELYSMNHLHYAAYDPVFYLHHANVDRLWVIWQELQKFRGLPAYESNCALELMNEPLKPFSFGLPYNLNPITYKYSKPADVFNYKDHFHYEYDMLEMNGMSIPQLESYIRHKKQEDRMFVGFLLEGFGSSAYATFEICNDAGECHEGSHFSVLGGSAEMPWAFDRLYRIEITKIIHDMHLEFDSHFTVKTKLVAQNGTDLSGILHEPTIVRVPAEIGEHVEVEVPLNKIRRNIETMEERDVQNLMSALRRLKSDESSFGFQTIADYHGSKMCPTPEAPEYACCLHGMPTFPHWHRVYLLHFEDAMRRHGANVAVPYWDWTLPISKLPSLLSKADYYDACTDNVIENPFLRGYIKHKDTYTVRDVQPELFTFTEGGKVSLLYKQVMLMLEQEDYCDFEVQLELIHNSIHYLIGGHQKYAMSSLVFSSFDPIFYIHHSMVDRLWAIWQELQQFRKLPYNKAYCALHQMAFPMKPFSWESNPNPHSRSVATPEKLFDYKSLGYVYDDLTFHGMDIAQLEAAIQRQKEKDRAFVGFLLHGIKTSADVHLKVCREAECRDAGVLFVLGGDTEMPWHFDRSYKMEITDVLKEMKISIQDLFHHNSTIHLEVEIFKVDGTHLDAGEIPKPSLIVVPGKDRDVKEEKIQRVGKLIRKNVQSLTNIEIDNLRDALAAVQADRTENGYQKIASYHGMPLSCHYPNGTAYACCQHGMVTFPHWHRLYVKQMEDAMRLRGARVGIPYWDWTTAFSSLPALVTDKNNNPFHHAHIDVANTDTTRAPRPQLFDDPEQGDESFFYRQIAFALEQTDFCDFEIQFEIGHNAIHSWVGGSSPYGMSTLHYTSYDPLFYLHHANTDRIWAIWQALQKYRGLPYNTANCEINKLKKPLSPFSSEENHNVDTKDHSTGFKSFDYHQLHYDYDNLNFHGMTIPQLDMHLKKHQEKDRVFAGFLLRTIGQSADVNFDVCRKDGECTFGGTFAILGGEHEMFWAFDRLFLYDISNSLNKLKMDAHDEFNINVTITAINGDSLPSNLLPPPTITFRPGTGNHHDQDYH